MVNVIRFNGEAFLPIQTLRTSALDQHALQGLRGVKQASDTLGRSIQQLRSANVTSNSSLADSANAKVEQVLEDRPTSIDTVRQGTASTRQNQAAHAANQAVIRGDGPDYTGLSLDVTA